MSGKTSQRLFRFRLERMIEQLRDDIASGRLLPGDYLPSETDLAGQFGMSNKSVRQGLDLLVEEELIRKIPRVGNQVTESAATRAEATITLGIRGDLERDMALSGLLDDFRMQYPDIRVNTITVPRSLHAFMKEFMEAGLVDLFIADHAFFQEMAEYRLLHTLEPLSVAPGTYRFLQESFASEDVLYGQPLFFSPLVLCYNKAHFRESGLPEPDSGWTWDVCLDYARKLTRKGERHGFVFYELSSDRWPVFLLQSGSAFERDRSGVCDIAGTPLLDSVRLYRRIIQDPDSFLQVLSESDDDTGQLFEKGKVSMILAGYSSMNAWKYSDLDYAISPLPYMREPRTLTIAYGACIRKSSANKREARLLVEFLGSEAAQMRIRRETLSLPSLKPAAEGVVREDLNRPSQFDLFRDILPSLRLHRDLNLTTAGRGILWGWLKLYGSQLIDEETLCRLVRERMGEHVRE
ncbi:extracellular solute-binding protein [Paenibacillus hodogayensis]|uniref:Extracellular solute-binding protein n=1 Tax=Paenibacillus hodogayensis TaxID=279208 RepID=A0ABV5W5K1_9BACL